MTNNIRGAGRKRKLSHEDEEAVYSDYRNNMPNMEIAFKYKISESTLSRIIKRIGTELKN